MKILVIDDNENLSTMFSRLMEAEGHECIVSNDGINGLTLIEQEKFDAIILDLNMPDFTGFDVIDALEKKGNLKKHKIVVLTATDLSLEKMEELKKRGIHACLKKPAKMDLLCEVLESGKIAGRENDDKNFDR